MNIDDVIENHLFSNKNVQVIYDEEYFITAIKNAYELGKKDGFNECYKEMTGQTDW